MALPIGAKAQEFTLTSTTGKPVVLSELSKRGPVVLAFFKVSCPTCQYAFPYFERMSRLHKPEAVSFVGISQNDLSDTQAFMKTYGVTFPVAIDDSKQYIVSNAYRLTNVPTAYLVDRDGKIQVSSVGWARKDMEELNQKLSMRNSDQQQHSIFKPGEEIAEYKAG
jgi:peroxiredoxin